jgi:hypothetical protein
LSFFSTTKGSSSISTVFVWDLFFEGVNTGSIIGVATEVRVDGVGGPRGSWEDQML